MLLKHEISVRSHKKEKNNKKSEEKYGTGSWCLKANKLLNLETKALVVTRVQHYHVIALF